MTTILGKALTTAIFINQLYHKYVIPHTCLIRSHSDDVTLCAAARIVDGRHREVVQRVRHQVMRRPRDIIGCARPRALVILNAL